MDLNFIPVGSLFKVFYTDKSTLLGSQDVYFISTSGHKHGINRAVLACGSQVCRDLLLDLYSCPIANSEDHVYISTNITDEDLEVIMAFFTDGMLPMDEAGKFSQCSKQLFKLFGLDLDYLNSPCNGNETESIKMEPEGEDFEDDKLECFVSIDTYPLLTEGKNKKRKLEEKKSGKSNGYFPKRSKNSSVATFREDPKYFFYFPQTGSRDLTKRYQCKRCVRGFKELFDYRQHYLRHEMDYEDYDKAFTCVRCYEYQSSSKKDVFDHGKEECKIKRHEDDQSCVRYFCVYCEGGKDLDTSTQWLMHMKDSHPEEERKLFRSYVCASCGKGWKGDCILAKHKRYEGPYHTDNCNTCGVPVDSWEEHQEHVRDFHDGTFEHKCGLCGFCKFDSYEEKLDHRKFCKYKTATHELRKVPKGKAVCTICDQEVDSASLVIRSHFLDFHPTILKKCPLCDKMFFDDLGHMNHMNRDHGQRLECDQCDRTFAIKQQLKTHKIDAHTPKGLKPYVCKVCKSVYETRYLLSKHMVDDHGKKSKGRRQLSPKVCELCGAELPHSSYKDHMRRFHGNDNVPCDKCDMTFKHELMYQQHYKRVHTFVTCEECGEQIGSLYLKRHKLSRHTAEHLKPYVCTICDPPKGFITKTNYVEHNYIHTGSRPYTCMYCPKTFNNSSNRIKHVRQSHREMHQARMSQKPKDFMV